MAPPFKVSISSTSSWSRKDNTGAFDMWREGISLFFTLWIHGKHWSTPIAHSTELASNRDGRQPPVSTRCLLSLHSDVASSGSGRRYSGVCKELALDQNRLPLTSGASDHFVSVYVTSVQAQWKDGANSSPESTAMSSLSGFCSLPATLSLQDIAQLLDYTSCWWSSRDHCLPKGLRYF